MKNNYLVLSFLLLQYVNIESYNVAITYQVDSKNNFEDNVFLYCKTKYFAYKYDLPFLYKYFPDANLLNLNVQEKKTDPKIFESFDKFVFIQDDFDLENYFFKDESVLFVCTKDTDTPVIALFAKQRIDFEEELKQLLVPVDPIPKKIIPPGTISLALIIEDYNLEDLTLSNHENHDANSSLQGFYIRKCNKNTGTIDFFPIERCKSKECTKALQQLFEQKNKYFDYAFPLQFPPWNYYKEQIQYIIKKLPDYSFHITLFTSIKNTKTVHSFFKNAFRNNTNISFSEPFKFDNKSENILKCIYTATHYNYLISNHSPLSSIAQLIGNFSLFVMPGKAVTLPNNVIINKVHYVEVSTDESENRKVNHATIINKIKLL